MAEYAFWLQHERSRADKPLVRDFHKAGWFERRISWFLEFMDVMQVTFEMLEEEMRRISATTIYPKKMDTREAVKTFFEAIKKARNKDQERENG
jgi:lipopolysaccharide biosynthesis regulator YciM